MAAGMLALAVTAPFPTTWIHGAPDCASSRDPMFQVHEMDPDTHVLRMSKCANFEAPFLYLLIGERRALLLDSGARPTAGPSDVRAAVDRILAGRAVELVVAHSHGHGDHHAGDDLFRDRPRTTVAGTKPADVHAFFGLDSTPEATYDLGGRSLRVLAIPGHEPAHIAVYDPRHRLLLTGDTLYPGMLTIRDWPAYRASIRRLHAFARTSPVDWILGAHVEMTKHPGVMYPLETLYQPEEHPLPLAMTHLAELAAAVEAMGETARRDVHDAFILEPVAPAPDPPAPDPPAPDPPAVHGMLLVGDESLFVSHLPLFHSPHDYQVILEVKLPEEVRRAYVTDRRASGEKIYTLAPERFVLPDQVQARRAFRADLYHGHFEREGTVLAAGVSVEISRVIHFRKLEAGRAAERRDEGLLFGRGGEAYLAHRISAPPDFDQVVAVYLAGGAPAETVAVHFGREPLAAGQRLELTVAGSPQPAIVQRVFYTEFEDLKAP